jgi:hypothetical protein
MPFPDPEPGLVIGYSYLWFHEDRAGKIEGRKDRPCAIIVVTENDTDEKIVTVFPITHTPPEDITDAVEIPANVKKRLGLDGERSWIICSELNTFLWPGPDLRPVSRKKKDEFSYGLLPPDLFEIVLKKFGYLARGRRLKVVERPE